jgi:oligosaccharide repeat unit polymerase
MYEIYCFVAVSALLLSWMRFRYFLHPHFVMTVIVITLFMSDFIVKGYSDPLIASIPDALLLRYQALVLFIIVAIIGGSIFLSEIFPVARPNCRIELRLSPAAERYFSWVALPTLLLDLFKRIHLSNWSIEEAIMNSFGPRAAAPWNYGAGVMLGNENFIYAPLTILMPFSGLFFAYQLSCTDGIRKLLSGISYVLVCLIIFAEGSRTPFIMVIVGYVLFFIFSNRSVISKMAVTASATLLIMAVTSAMYLYRTEGYIQEETFTPYELTYHQDDNYYRTLTTMYIAETTDERWDPASFLIAIIANPIPRSFWPDKIILDANYWGSYKEEYVTISYIAELIAMSGQLAGIPLGIAVGLLLFLLLTRAFRILETPGGLIIYIIIVVYVYMVMRSLLNISQFGYLPMAACLAYFYANWQSKRSRNEAPVV